METNPSRHAHTVVFVGFKTAGPIPVVGPFDRDRLIQLSLDGDVVRLAHIYSRWGEGFTVALRHDGRNYVQIIAPGRREAAGAQRFAVEAGFDVETIEPRDVSAEPRRSAARSVWCLRRRPVDARSRFAMLEVLREDGPMRLAELCRRVPGPSDPILGAATLACEGVIVLDLEFGFGPDTPVRATR